MREIKFRCWQVFDEDEEGNPKWQMIGADELVFINYEPLRDLLKNDPDSEIFMQYTGLKDKNGKEIYEGDIVEMKIERAEYEGQDEDEWKVWYEKGKVEFSSGCFWINTNGHSINCHFHYNDSHREVIGNIYENPELLEAK